MESAVATVVTAVVVAAVTAATVTAIAAVPTAVPAAVIIAAARPENQQDDNPPAGIIAEAIAARVITHNMGPSL